MTLDDQLRRTLASLAECVREETERQISTLTTQLTETIAVERAAAAAEASAEAKSAAEKELNARLASAAAIAEAHEKDAIAAVVAAAETRERAALTAAAEARAAQARQAAHAEGRLLGKAEGEELGRLEGHREGLEEGRQEGRIEGRIQGRAEGREEGRLEGRRAGHELGLKEGKRLGKKEGRKEGFAGAAELAANERLLDAIRAIDGGRSLTEVLDTLASSAGREAARVALLLVRGGQLRGWRFIGFGEEIDRRQDVDVQAADAGAAAEAARTGAAVSADSSTPGSAPSFASLPPGRELLAVPVQMSGQAVAVLYADQGEEGSAGNLSWPSTLEVLARHAARCLESITAFRAAQLLTERPDISGLPAPDAAARARSTAGEGADAAKRYARLLVSEIKLYHESAVLAGRRERDLGIRLGAEIAQARVLYDQRVPGEVRAVADYFHEELVRTLADGEASLLHVRS